MTATKKVFFTDEKNFYLNPPVNNQCLDCHCLLLQRASLLHAPWFLLASPSKVKDDFTSHQKRPKWTQNFYFATETGFRLQDSSASWLHFPTGWCTCIHCTCSTHSSGSPPTAPDSLSRMSGRQTLRTWICWISAGLSCLGNTLQCYHSFSFSRSQKASTSWRMPSSQSGMCCHRTQSTRQCWVSPRDYEHVLKLVVDTSNILCNKPLFCIIELLCFLHVNRW